MYGTACVSDTATAGLDYFKSYFISFTRREAEDIVKSGDSFGLSPS